MKKIKLLDCTLRDGGFVNEWDFGQKSVLNIFSRLNAGGIDIIELGFINNTYSFDIGRTIMPHTKYLKEIFKLKPNPGTKLVAMVIMGEADLENIGPKSDTPIDGLRIVFKKSGIKEAFEFAKGCRDKGYSIFFQPASITDYSEAEMIELIKLANIFRPEAFYIVDTYGLLDKELLFFYLDIIDKHLGDNISLGYHSHNNYQLSYASAIDFIEKKKKHDIIIDCTLFGMGKGTGNLNTELIVDYLTKKHGFKYDNSQILEAVDSEILQIRKNYVWGYSLNGFIAASNNCHPSYVQYLLDKKALSVKSINKVLSNIESNKRTNFNKMLIEKLYLDYQSVDIDDGKNIEKLKEVFKNKKILILSPGLSLNKYYKNIQKFIAENHPVVITVNHLPDDFKIDFCFINNSKRFSQMAVFLNDNHDFKIIALSNILQSYRHIDYEINYSKSLVSGDADVVSENATLMLFKLLIRCQVKDISIAGFDGFKNSGNNYVNKYLTYNKNKDIKKQNELIAESLKSFEKQINLSFLTPSLYTNADKTII